MKKIEMTHSDFHDIVMNPLKEEITDALRLYFNLGFEIIITESVAPFTVRERITTQQQFDTWFGAKEE